MATLSGIITSTSLITANNTLTLANKTLTAPVINSPTGIVKGDVGLGNVDNTSDVAKNAATVTLTNKTLTSPVINTPTGIVKGDVGLGNVDNTSDATKNAATATLTNKTLTTPTINGVTGVVDINTGAAIASASTINLDTATGNRVHITGTTPITAVTLTRGPRTVIFDDVLTLTHNTTTNNLPGLANIITAAGDRAIYESDGTTVYCISYIKAGGAVSSITRSARTSNTVLGAGDQGKLIDVTSGSFTQTFGTAAALGAGWVCDYKNSGTGEVVLEPATFGSEIISNGDFSTIATDADIAVNGTFSADTNWTKISTTISGGTANISLVTNATVLTQTGAPAVIPGKTYKVTYTILNWVSGGVRPEMGGMNGENSTYAAGTYSCYITAGSTAEFRFTAFNNTTLSLDNVSVVPLSNLILSGSVFSTPTAAITFTSATSGSYMGMTFAALTVGANYLFTFTLSSTDQTDSRRWIEVQLLGGATVTLPCERVFKNGTYRISFTATAAHTQVRLVWQFNSGSFSGIIDTLSLKPILNAIDNVAFIPVRNKEAITISSDGSNFTTSRSNPRGTAKAWLRCNADGGIISSFNITSITDTSTGVVLVTLPSNMSSAEYVLISNPTGLGTSLFSTVLGFIDVSRTTFKVSSVARDNGTPYDSAEYNIVCFGA